MTSSRDKSSAEVAADSSRAATRWSPVVLGCLAATWFLWGTMYLAIKWALVSFPPFFQMGSQYVVAGAVLAAVARLRGSPWPRAKEWLGGAVMGALLISGGYGFMALAESSVGSGLVVAFTAIVPTMVVLGEWPYGVRPDRRQAAGVALGLVGIVMLTQGQGFGAAASRRRAASSAGWIRAAAGMDAAGPSSATAGSACPSTVSREKTASSTEGTLSLMAMAPDVSTSF